MKPPYQLRIANPVIALVGDLDPSKLILMDPPYGNFHPINWVNFE